ncbi:MAG: cysteine hydrolase family protein [Eudoraea sp.]|uniref:cysteine hydrolase family protein n=1 Tax=Eudoraea sp. TaxID=1979955 RepID=UPI003263D5AA
MNSESKPALLLIDIQKGLDDIDYYGGHRNNLQAESNARKVLDFWRNHKLPIFHIKHNSTNPNSPLVKGQTGNYFKDIVKPLANETIIEKEVNSAFMGTDLKQQLDELEINELIIAGLTTDHCISSSARMAGNLGYKTYVVSDATATFDKVGANGIKYEAELIHEVALASLHNEFATVIESNDLLKSIKKTL